MATNIKYGIIHTHSEHSCRDSAMSTEQLCKRAAEMGAPAVVLTDHGTMTGTLSFMRAAKNNGIKGIPGLEAYLLEDDAHTKRCHLLLIPKSYTGYQAIAKALTKANTRIIDGFPCMNTAILREFFAEGACGHGEVIATSACVSGVLARILLRNSDVEQEAEKLKQRQSKYARPDEEWTRNQQEKLAQIQSSIEDMVNERERLKKIAARKFTQREKAIAALKKTAPEEYEAAVKKLHEDRQETQDAEARLNELKPKIARRKKEETNQKAVIREMAASTEKWTGYQESIERLCSLMASDEELRKEATQRAVAMEQLFGKGNFYIELQYHGLSDEQAVMPIIADIAKKQGLPVVACNDAHFASRTVEDQLARQIITSLRFNRWEPERPDHKEYYVKTDEDLSQWLSRILDKETVKSAMEGIGNIINQCNVEMPTGLHYPVFVTPDGSSSAQWLRAMAEKGIEKRYPSGTFTSAHRERMEYELAVIEKLGYSSYLCIVQDFLEYARSLGGSEPGSPFMNVGPGRGSAVGSIVCYLIGITGIDPIQYGLLFERFLNVDRVTQPDIDSDFRNAIRDIVLEYVKKRYGENAVCNIMAKGTLAAKGAIRAAARAFGYRDYDSGTAYLDLASQIAAHIPNAPGAEIADVESTLMSVYASDSTALEIIHAAELIEGTIVQYGVHAAGVIVADNGDIRDYLPLMWNENKQQWVCQADKDEVETDAGLLKMDFLNLTNLSVIDEALRLIWRNHGTRIDMEEIGRALSNGRTTPFDKKGNVFDDIFSKALTNSVFQFESDGMKQMLRQFRPTRFEDLILLVAAYRPGPMQYLDEIMKVKRGQKKTTYLVPALKEILGETYGKPIFQEQVMQIFNRVAGFSLGEADIIRRAMSKKKLAILTDEKRNYKGRFIDGLKAAGATQESAENFWEELLDFAKYAFNKSHAAAYAMVAYYTAWLKLNYPVEYMTAALNFAAFDKIGGLIAECRRMRIEVLPPDIRLSDVRFKCVEGKILYGLGAIKSVGSKVNEIIEQRNAGRIVSFKDFLFRMHQDKTTTENLIKCGALDTFCSCRSAMLQAVESLTKNRAKILEKQASVQEQENALKEKLSLAKLPDDLMQLVAEKKVAKKSITQLLRTRKALAEYRTRFDDIILDINTPESRLSRLESEKELLGAYVSGHPFDEYLMSAKEKRSAPIAELNEGFCTACGIIEDVRYYNRKTDNALMAFFKLSDDTGEIRVCCFAKAYAKYAEYVAPGAAVAIEGKCGIKQNNDDSEEKELYVTKITDLEKTRQTLVISVANLIEWKERVYPIVQANRGQDYTVVVYDCMLGELRKCSPTIAVNSAIFKTDLDIRLIDNH